MMVTFVVLAIWSVWPAALHPYNALPTNAFTPGTVPMFNAWSIWWNADRLPCGLAGYWDAPIFHPESGTFAYSEPQPATLAVAPIVWVTGSPVPAYHVYLIGSLVLNAVFAVRVLRTLRVDWFAAAAGGIAVLLLPLVHHNLDVLQLMPLWGVLWTIETLIKHHRRPSWRRGIVMGIAFSSVFMTCVHHGIFLTLLLGLTAWITLPLRRWKPWLAGIATAGATSAVLLLPLLMPMHRVLEGQQFSREESLVKSLSSTPREWLEVAPRAVIGLPGIANVSERPQSPGWIRTALALVGVLLAMWHVRHRRAVVFLVMLAGMAVLCSLGLNLRIGSWQPWVTLSERVPGFAQVRSVYRFAYFGQLAVVLLAALGLDRSERWLRLHWRANWVRRVSSGVFTVCCLLVAFEIPPQPMRLADVPDVSVVQPWMTYLREHVSEGRSVVCLPFSAGYSVEELEQSTRWMMYGCRHHLPLVNGYSGFFPNSWYDVLEACNEDPFGEWTLKLLAKADVEYVVIDSQWMQAGPPPGRTGRYQLTEVFSDDSGFEVWRLDVPSE